MKRSYSLPLNGHVVSDVTGTERFKLLFDNPAKSRLDLDSPFTIQTGSQIDERVLPFYDWVRDVLLSLVGVIIWYGSDNVRIGEAGRLLKTQNQARFSKVQD